MTALYHPAALLRDPGKKPETFQDLKRLQAKHPGGLHPDAHGICIIVKRPPFSLSENRGPL